MGCVEQWICKEENILKITQNTAAWNAEMENVKGSEA